MKNRPLLKELYQYVTPRHAAGWFEIGIQLGLSCGELKAIKAGNPTDVKWCCNEMWMQWLQEDATASWEKLFMVINSPAILCSASDEGT